jgi:CheY-like chemotaxis protein
MAHVLVVDDEGSEASRLQAAYVEDGSSVVVATSAEALAAIALAPPDVVLLCGAPARELARSVGTSFPTLPLIILDVARGRAPPLRDESLPPTVERVLERPVAVDALAYEVESLLHEAHARGAS